MSTFRNSIQGAITSLEQGVGLAILRLLLLTVLGASVFGAYAWSQFAGLKDAPSMEYAQLARQLAAGQGFTTQCIRPFDLQHRPWATNAAPASAARYPDLRHGPVWPSILATGFKLMHPSFAPPTTAGIFEPERTVIVPAAIILSLATGLLVLLLGTVLFDYRTGLVAVSLVFLNTTLLREAVSGSCIPAATFFATAAIAMGVFAVRLWDRGHAWSRWTACVVLCALLCAAAFLTTYSALILLPILLVWFRVGFTQRRWLVIPLYLLVFALSVTPWLIRNRAVAGGITGLAPYAAAQESLLFPGDSLDRSPDPSLHNVRLASALKAKFKRNAEQILDGKFGLAGAGIMAAFFIVSLFHRFEEAENERLKWHIVLGLALLAVLLAVRGVSAAGLTHIFFPLIILFGTAFFFVLVNRLSTYQIELENSLAIAIVAFSAAPFLLTIAGQHAPVPYPPYYPPLNAYAACSVEPDKMICTDIPQATAWYGNRTSLLLPNTVEEFMTLTSQGLPCSALYLTSDADSPRTAGGAADSWSMILDRRVPENFPLRHGVDLPPGTRDQLLLTESPGQTAASADGPGAMPDAQ